MKRLFPLSRLRSVFVRLAANTKSHGRHATIPMLAAATLLCCAGAPASPHYTPPGSFLKYRAATVNELVYQTNQYSDVRLKYARHFGVNPQKVPAYFRTLDLIALKKPARLKTWFYDKNNKCRSRMETLPKGSLVFASSDGKPVLSWSCGNPLSKPNVELALKQYEKTKAAALTAKTKAKPIIVAQKPQTLAEPPVEVKVLADAPEVISAPEKATESLLTPAEQTALPAPLPAPQVVAQLPDLVAAPAAAEVLTQTVSHGFNALPYLGGLAGVVGGLVAARGGGDSQAPVVVPIPEPSSAFALAAGLAGLAGIRRKRGAA